MLLAATTSDVFAGLTFFTCLNLFVTGLVMIGISGCMDCLRETALNTRPAGQTELTKYHGMALVSGLINALGWLIISVAVVLIIVVFRR